MRVYVGELAGSLFKTSFRSYQAVTLFGLWLIPLATSVYFVFWRMVIIWTVFSCITIFVIFRATRKRISVKTPRYLDYP